MLRRMIGSSEMLLRMPDTGAGSGGGEGTGQQPAGNGAGTGDSGAGGGSGGGMSLEQALAELEKVRKALKDVNAESAGRRKRLEELETAEQARQQAQMSEAERAAKAVKTLEEKLATLEQQQVAHRDEVVRYEVMLKAQELQIVDPDAAVKLMDAGSLEFGEDGRPRNVTDVLKRLVKEKAYLVKPASGAGGMGTPPQRQRQPAGVTGAQTARKVTPL